MIMSVDVVDMVMLQWVLDLPFVVGLVLQAMVIPRGLTHRKVTFSVYMSPKRKLCTVPQAHTPSLLGTHRKVGS